MTGERSAVGPRRLAIVVGETLEWSANTGAYDRLTMIDREADLFVIGTAGAAPATNRHGATFTSR